MNQNTTQETVTRHFDVTAEEFDSIYTGEGKSFWGKLLDRSLRKDMYERFTLTVENCGDDPDRTILDVGCGTGRFSIALAQRNARVDGIDPAPTMLAIATRLASEQGVADKCRFIEADLDNFSAAEKYDYVIGIGLFDYLATPAAALKRMTGLAKKRVIVTFPRRWTWRAPIRKLRLSLRGCPVFFYDRAQVEKLVRDAGGQIEEVRVVGKIYFVMFAPTDSHRK
ncbi:MAG TPA: methyltransferase domain-containing protein [Candidatus Latescibacteria bacterium]|nr:methyltransferase domain-containing protein [Candidatus Latescibacterota bacterium]HPC45823.1 methyltransferase domain-containing protein [Candidatus Latescibacterota bacterium]HQI77063.1 methyltransferase domain-containing protein [Candidatus Latescibacterota bacterium]HQK22956.1 methyltransferase domain-containing protein [Candidatus Latescibacterota bacterium]